MAFCSHPKYDAYVFLSAIDVRSTSTWDSSSMRGAWARDEGGHRHRWENLGPRCSAMDRTGLLHLTSPVDMRIMFVRRDYRTHRTARRPSQRHAQDSAKHAQATPKASPFFAISSQIRQRFRRCVG